MKVVMGSAVENKNKASDYFRTYSNIFKFIDVAAITVILSLFLIGIYLISKYNPHVWVDLIFDDAYYYLGIARNITLGLGSSFLPPFHTNGYQPLWMLILVLTSNIFGVSDRSLFLQIYCLSFFFVFVFAYLSRKYYGYFFPAIALSITYPVICLYGMETTLLPPLIILFFSSRNWAERGFWSSLIFMTRLDALALVIARDAYVCLRDRKHDFNHYLIVIPVAVFYCLTNYYFFDILVPVSGLAKSIGNIRGENIYPFLAYLSEFSSVAFFIPIICIIFLRKEIYYFRYKEEIVSCLLAILICATYYSINSGWPVWDWYYWPVFMLIFYCCLEILNYYLVNLSRISLAKYNESPNKSDEILGVRHGCVTGLLKKRHVQYMNSNYLMLLMVVITFTCVFYPASYDFSRRWKLFFKPENNFPSWGKRNVELVDYIKKRNIAKNTFFAMGDRSGSFGFFLGPEFRFLQTEGLVASTEYYRSMVNDSALSFLDKIPIDYFIVERGTYLAQDDVIGIIEPVQALSSHYGQWLVCFNRSDVLMNQADYYHRRYIFKFKTHIQCPTNMVNQYLEMKSKYGGVRKFSLPEEYYKGTLQTLFNLKYTNLPHF